MYAWKLVYQSVYNLGFLVIMVMTQGYEGCDITLPYIIYETLAYVFHNVSVLKLEAAVSSETSICSYHDTWHKYQKTNYILLTTNFEHNISLNSTHLEQTDGCKDKIEHVCGVYVAHMFIFYLLQF